MSQSFCRQRENDSVINGEGEIRAGGTGNLSAPIAHGRCRSRSGPYVLGADADPARVNLPWDHSRAGICTLSRYLSIYRRLTFWTRTVVGKYWSRPHIATLVRTYAPEASWISQRDASARTVENMRADTHRSSVASIWRCNRRFCIHSPAGLSVTFSTFLAIGNFN